MKTYHISTSVKEVHGTQVWAVQAESPSEALAKYESTGGEFVAEEIEVQRLAEPTLEDVQEIHHYKCAIITDKYKDEKGDRHLVGEGPKQNGKTAKTISELEELVRIGNARAERLGKEILELRDQVERLEAILNQNERAD